MRPPFIYAAIIAAVSLLTQQNGSLNDALLFPTSNDLLLAAQHGYAAGTDSRMDLVYQPPWRFLIDHSCSRVTWQVRAAGPLLLAAMEGQTAKMHSQGMPATDDILHSRGTLLLQILFSAREPEERATAVLVVGTREFQPLETDVNKVDPVPCASGFYGTQYSVTQVRETFTFGFAPSQVQPDWNNTVQLKVRRDNIVEPLDLTLLQALTDQAKRVRRTFH